MRLAMYSLLRLGLYGVCLGLLYVVGMRGWLLVLLPAFLAWGLSYVLLNGPRDAAAKQIAEAAERRRARGGRPDFGDKAQQEADYEDAVDEAARHDAELHDAELHDAELHDAELHDVAEYEPPRREAARDDQGGAPA